MGPCTWLQLWATDDGSDRAQSFLHRDCMNLKKCNHSIFYLYLQNCKEALTVNHNFCDVDFTDKAIHCFSEVTASNVKYAVRDVLVTDVLHSERIPLFWQIRYISNIDAMWILCGQILVPFMHPAPRLLENGLPGKWHLLCHSWKWNWNVKMKRQTSI